MGLSISKGESAFSSSQINEIKRKVEVGLVTLFFLTWKYILLASIKYTSDEHFESLFEHLVSVITFIKNKGEKESLRSDDLLMQNWIWVLVIKHCPCLSSLKVKEPRQIIMHNTCCSDRTVAVFQYALY